MPRVKVRLNFGGFRELRKSPAVAEDLAERAIRIRQACGPGYAVGISPSRNRARVTVYPDTIEAELDNARNLTLLRNLDRGRGRG